MTPITEVPRKSGPWLRGARNCAICGKHLGYIYPPEVKGQITRCPNGCNGK